MTLEALNAPVAVGALILLWSAEALWPALAPHSEAPTQRVRHLVLGLLNAGVAAISAIGLLAAVRWAAGAEFGLLRLGEIPWWMSLAVGFVALDLWQYLLHVAMHKVPVLWRMHAVHHNAERLEATLAWRFHVGEALLGTASVIPLAVVLGLDMTHVLLYNLVLLPVSLFHHADINLPARVDRVLRLVVVTPRMHWIHHSRWQPETDSNYAAVFPWWDFLFRTFRSRRHAETVDIGLDNQPAHLTRTLRGMLLAPFSRHRPSLGERPAPELIAPDRPVFARRPRRQAERRSGRADATA